MPTNPTVIAGEALRDHIISTADWMLVQSLSAQGAQEEMRDAAGVALARISEAKDILTRSTTEANQARDKASAAIAGCIRDQAYLRELLSKLRSEKEAGMPPFSGTLTAVS